VAEVRAAGSLGVDRMSQLFDGSEAHGSRAVRDRVDGKMSAWDRRLCEIYDITEAEWLERAKKTRSWLERFHARPQPGSTC